MKPIVRSVLKKLRLQRRSRWEALEAYKLLIAICAAIVVALILTSVSLVLYGVTGAATLDLSRPGYESARTKVQSQNIDVDMPPFAPTGKIDQSDMKQYLSQYKKRQLELKGYDSFNPTAISDAQLNLGPVEPVEPQQ